MAGPATASSAAPGGFAALGLPEVLLRGVAQMGFTQPTPIQQQAIPPALRKRDLLGCAMTGSGKTAAFMLPTLAHLLAKPSTGYVRVLVLTPTRELAAQIEEHARGLAAFTDISMASVFGGVAPGPQEAAFRRGVHIIIATPGRLLDHLQAPYARLDRVEHLVVDEADRMFDMGFLPDVRRVLSRLPKARQTMLFSATMPPPIVELARELLHDPVFLNHERQAAPATGVRQSLYPVAQDLKSALLVALIRAGVVTNAIVFTRTKHRANRLHKYLEQHGVRAERIHGNRSQAQRTQALAEFKSGTIPILVATDIVARGIDVEELSHVLNFDVPHMPEDYIHRVGRTARAAATGDAITFVAPDEEGDLAGIERAIGARLPRLTLPGFDYSARPQEKLEIPLGERIAEIRARKAEERARAREKAERRAAAAAGLPVPPRPRPASAPGGGPSSGAPAGGAAVRAAPAAGAGAAAVRPGTAGRPPMPAPAAAPPPRPATAVPVRAPAPAPAVTAAAPAPVSARGPAPDAPAAPPGEGGPMRRRRGGRGSGGGGGAGGDTSAASAPAPAPAARATTAPPPALAAPAPAPDGGAADTAAGRRRRPRGGRAQGGAGSEPAAGPSPAAAPVVAAAPAKPLPTAGAVAPAATGEGSLPQRAPRAPRASPAATPAVSSGAVGFSGDAGEGEGVAPRRRRRPRGARGGAGGPEA